MSINEASGAAASESSATEDNQADSGDPSIIKTEVTTQEPPNADLQRLKDDMLKYKKESQESKKIIESLKQQKLKEQNDFKTLYETAHSELEQFRTGYVKEKKREALRSAVQKLGLRAEAEQDLDLLGLDPLTEELTTEGRVIVHGAEQYAQQLKQQRGHWFKTNEPPRINSGGGAKPDTPQTLTANYMVELERKDPKKYKELYPKYVEQLRKNKG